MSTGPPTGPSMAQTLSWKQPSESSLWDSWEKAAKSTHRYPFNNRAVYARVYRVYARVYRVYARVHARVYACVYACVYAHTFTLAFTLDPINPHFTSTSTPSSPSPPSSLSPSVSPLPDQHID